MSILRSIEHKIEALVEGMFGRAFRTNVQPVELARKLAKEMDDGRTISVSRVYVPNEYTVYLSQQDRAQFETYEDLAVGEFGIATRMVQPERGRARERPERPSAARAGETMVYKQAAVPTEAVSAEELDLEPEPAVLEVDGERHRIDRGRVVI